MKAQPIQQKITTPQADTEKNGKGKTLPPPQFALQNGTDSGAGVAQKKDAGTAQKEEAGVAQKQKAGVAQKQDAGGQGMLLAQSERTTVIDDNQSALAHYYDGGGRAVDIGPYTIDLLRTSRDFQFRRNRILKGETASLSGSFSVDMTMKMFHIGRTNVDYKIQVNGNQCTVTYTLFVDDGFWDVNFAHEQTYGRIGLPWFKPDGKGSNLELPGGKPYSYNTVTYSETFNNPGYK